MLYLSISYHLFTNYTYCISYWVVFEQPTRCMEDTTLKLDFLAPEKNRLYYAHNLLYSNFVHIRWKKPTANCQRFGIYIKNIVRPHIFPNVHSKHFTYKSAHCRKVTAHLSKQTGIRCTRTSRRRKNALSADSWVTRHEAWNFLRFF